MAGSPSRYGRCSLHRSCAFIILSNQRNFRPCPTIISKERLKFQEFLDTVLLFSRGKTEDKLRIIFDMCDKDSNGVIDKEELSEMLRSLVEIARTTSLSDDHVTELIDGMFQVFIIFTSSRISRIPISYKVFSCRYNC